MKAMFMLLVLLIVVFAISLAAFSFDTINYQGKLMDSEDHTAINETKDIIFTIYQETEHGTWASVWTELHDNVSISSAFFSVALNNVNQNWLDIDFSRNIKVEISIADADGTNEEVLDPRLPLTFLSKSKYSEIVGTIDGSDGGTIGNALTVDENGYVGIGTKEPEGVLNIVGDDEQRLFLETTSGTSSAAVTLKKPDGTSDASDLWMEWIEGDAIGTLGNQAYFMGYQGGPGENYFSMYSTSGQGIGMGTDQIWSVLDGTNDVIFHGRLGIGTRNPKYDLDVKGDIRGNSVKANGWTTGDIIFQKDGKKLWRMFEDKYGLYLENVSTGETSKVFLEKDIEKIKIELKAEIIEEIRKELTGQLK